jgi:nucleoid-associated protein YgaU
LTTFVFYIPLAKTIVWAGYKLKLTCNMGLLSFIKNAGAALIGGSKSEPKAPQPATAPGDDAMKKLADSQMALKLTNHVASMELKVENLNIEVDDDKATVYGETVSQSEKEKIVLTIGNVAGIASVDDRLTVAVQEPESQFYTVVSGDSLSKIAKNFYGNPGKYTVIFEANKPMLKDPDKIYPGQVLRIPPLS